MVDSSREARIHRTQGAGSCSIRISDTEERVVED